jgi:hypothetical protein
VFTNPSPPPPINNERRVHLFANSLGTIPAMFNFDFKAIRRNDIQHDINETLKIIIIIAFYCFTLNSVRTLIEYIIHRTLEIIDTNYYFGSNSD